LRKERRRQAKASRKCVMLEWLVVALMSFGTLQAPCQSSKYEPGTITRVTSHQRAPGEPDNVARYDVAVKVGNTVFVVLYTPPSGANGVEHSAGHTILVLVGSDTLTFNSAISGTTEVPILSRETLPVQPGPDWSKASGQYFSMKQQHLAETLELSEDQQAKIKPILEQETGEAGQFLGNPVLSRTEQLKRWEKVVQASDAKIKPLLSDVQLDKLQQLRTQQKEELKRIIAEGKPVNPK
jgi:hypothetical protein